MIRRAVVTLLLAVVAAGCGAPAVGHWTDPGVRLVDGVWIGPAMDCPTRDECPMIARGAMAGLSDADRSQVAQVQWVSLPTSYVTANGEPRTPRPNVGVRTWAAALVTFGDGRERVVGLSCGFGRTSDGNLAPNASCDPAELIDWKDGVAPPSYPPGTTFG